MLSKRPQRKKLPADYAVRFVGYMAVIFALKRRAKYAELHFGVEMVRLYATGGHVTVLNRLALSSVVAGLPLYIDELKSLMKEATPSNNDRITLDRGEARIRMDRVADVDRFVRQITQRFREIEPILESVERIGSGIIRQPYHEYVQDIGETGTGHLEFYGDAFVVGGELSYRPERQKFAVKLSEDDQVVSITPI
jgi:hypothetical protein